MKSSAEILIVDDDPATLATLARTFRLAGYEATVCDNAARALELALSRPFDLILSDVVMPRRDGIALLEDLKSHGVTSPIVMVSGQAHIEMAVRATRLGALDFLEKPLSTEKLLLTLQNAIKLKRLETENKELRRRVGTQEMIWTGEAMQRIIAQIDRVAPSESRVCIYGETGTGKELVARSLHEKSSRHGGPFITLNCAAIPGELIESQLFGHEKGAFTGAAQRHIGKFEQAHRGTLFLDEIGDMPPLMQAKLLRVLEGSEVERVGADKPMSIDVRIIVATHRDLDELVKQGSFRQDLYHRVVVFPIQLPPLRQRQDDIPALIEHFAREVCRQNSWKPAAFSAGAISALQHYSWPGNIRELRNVVERLILLADVEVDLVAVRLALPLLDAKSHTRVSSEAAIHSEPLAGRVAAFERATVAEELERNHGHITNTAKALGIERSHLYKKCQQLGIDLKTS